MSGVYKCIDCGQDTTNSYTFEPIRPGRPGLTVHRCDRCQERFDMEFDFQNEGETIREDELICPWCQTSFDDYDAYEYEEGEEEGVECPFCGKHFDLEVETRRMYSTKRSLCDMPEDFGEEDRGE